MIGGKIALTCLVIFLTCVLTIYGEEKSSKTYKASRYIGNTAFFGIIVGLLMKIWSVQLDTNFKNMLYFKKEENHEIYKR